MLKNLSRFNLLYCLFIIVWGAWVRLSDSGDGCGQHWPLCDGEVIPASVDLKKWTEFFHRATSGLFGLSVLWQVGLSWKKLGARHPACVSAWCAAILTLIEALIGAFLVKKGLVAESREPLRILVMSLHLVNTFLLLAALTMADFWKNASFKCPKAPGFYDLMGIVLLLVVAALGAMASLAHDWFPSANLLQGLAADFDPQKHWLVRVRIFHPLVAILTTVFLFVGTCYRREHGNSRESFIFLILLAGQLFVGVLNWALMAPPWSALLHLVLADLIWIGFIRQVCCVCKGSTGPPLGSQYIHDN